MVNLQPIQDSQTELRDMIAVCCDEKELTYLMGIDYHLREAIEMLARKTFDEHMHFFDKVTRLCDCGATFKDELNTEFASSMLRNEREVVTV